MSTEALAVVKQVYEKTAGLDRKHSEEDARARRSFAGASAEDVEFSFVGPGWEDSASGLPGSGRSRADFREAWEGWVEPFGSYRMWPLEYASNGDRVMVRIRAEATPAGASTPLEIEHGALLTVRDGLIARMDLFYRADDARAALERP